jgi:hypothetical protein
MCNAEGRKLIEFCENGFKILNGKYGPDTGGELTFFCNQLGSSVIDCVLASDGILSNAVDFKVGIEIISYHMPLLVKLGSITGEEVNTKSNARPETPRHTE